MGAWPLEVLRPDVIIADVYDIVVLVLEAARIAARFSAGNNKETPS